MKVKNMKTGPFVKSRYLSGESCIFLGGGGTKALITLYIINFS